MAPGQLTRLVAEIPQSLCAKVACSTFKTSMPFVHVQCPKDRGSLAAFHERFQSETTSAQLSAALRISPNPTEALVIKYKARSATSHRGPFNSRTPTIIGNVRLPRKRAHQVNGALCCLPVDDLYLFRARDRPSSLHELRTPASGFIDTWTPGCRFLPLLLKVRGSWMLRLIKRLP